LRSEHYDLSVISYLEQYGYIDNNHSNKVSLLKGTVIRIHRILINFGEFCELPINTLKCGVSDRPLHFSISNTKWIKNVKKVLQQELLSTIV
jgi:hypothetical protein